MGIEYHDQPDWLTKTVEISNLVFSIIFAIEMVLKLMVREIQRKETSNSNFAKKCGTKSERRGFSISNETEGLCNFY